MQQKRVPAKVVKYISRSIGSRPWICLVGALLVSAIVIIIDIVFILKGIKFEVSNKGWKSRGTLIAQRGMQSDIILFHQDSLYYDQFLSDFDKYPIQITENYDSPWEYLQSNVVPGYNPLGSLRKLETKKSDSSCNSNWFSQFNPGNENYLSAMYKGKNLLDPESVLEICTAERTTMDALKNGDFCSVCDQTGRCPIPFSLTTAIGAALGMDGSDSCEVLVSSYASHQSKIIGQLANCANALRDPNSFVCEIPIFSSLFVDTKFGVDGNFDLEYSSSYFSTHNIMSLEDDDYLYTADRLYQITGSFGKKRDHVDIVYDTSEEDFSIISQEEIMLKDVSLAFISVIVTTLAIFIHTKSMWLTAIGCVQIICAAPFAFFCYRVIGKITFFPVINLIGLFVSSALGADDLFVAVDKWKNARLENPLLSTEDIAELALPDAAGAMLLTTSTTSVAFFATCVSPVPPVYTFALFCGLLVIFNYVLNLALIFPSLALYDRWLMNGTKNIFVACLMKKENPYEQNQSGHDEGSDVEVSESFIHRLLSLFYKYLHQFRFIFLVVMIGVTAVCCYYAAGINLPENSDVRMLPDTISYEKHYIWFRKLLAYQSRVGGGNTVRFIFGLQPADNGYHRDPDTLSNLVLDDNFDPSTTQSQIFLKEFCGNLFQNEFAHLPYENYNCSINEFGHWLSEQAATTDQLDGFSTMCGDQYSLPMDPLIFHSCFSFWFREVGVQLYGEKNVLDRDGIVKVLWFDAITKVRFEDPSYELQRDWLLFENWMKNELKNGPHELQSGFLHGSVFWWKDTSLQVLNTALSAAAISVGFAAIIVLISSRSIRLTFFSVLCIVYILASATASLVSIGWELGFLESVCFAILIGISSDFVIHFTHAYNAYAGSVSRELRTESGLKHMGPSILASAITTFSSGFVMLFCTLTFFAKFAQMLMFTIVHAIIGSFIVYLTLTDIFGPKEPTKLFNRVVAKITGRQTSDDDIDEDILFEDNPSISQKEYDS